MKRISMFFAVMIASLSMMLFAAPQGAKDDIKDAGTDVKKAGQATGKATVKAGQATEKATVKAGEATGKGTVKVVKKTGSVTKKTTKKVVHKSADAVSNTGIRLQTRLPTRSSAAAGWVWLLISAALGVLFIVLWPAIPQPQDYHFFADRRSILGIPNFWNVVSNLPFAVVGILGLRAFRDTASQILFAGILLTAFGSGYYHLHPNDATLVWDRLPMTLVFMALLALMISQWIEPIWGRRLLWPLILFGIASIAWWQVTGDLRPYAVAQFGPVLVLLPAMWFEPKLRGLWPVLAFYALAKMAEFFDVGIFSAISLSGHTLKHLAAGLAAYWILRWRRAAMLA